MDHPQVARDVEIQNLIEAAKRVALRMNGSFVVDDSKVQSFRPADQVEEKQERKRA